MRPAVQVIEEWGVNIVVTSRTLCHRPSSLPVLRLLCCCCSTVSMELKDKAVPLATTRIEINNTAERRIVTISLASQSVQSIGALAESGTNGE